MITLTRFLGTQNESTEIVAIIAGNAKNEYMTVVRILSKRPLRSEANIAVGTPTKNAMHIAPKLTKIETLDPKIIRDRISLPRSSVPSKLCSVGPLFTAL